MATNFVPRFAAVTLTDGAAATTDLADGAVITDYIMNMTMPEVRILPKTAPVSGGRAQQTLQGPVEIDEFSMTMHGIYAGILASWTRDVNLTITRELVSYPALGGALQTIEIGGTVMGVKMGDMDFQAADGLIGDTIRLALHSFKVSKSGVTAAMWDISFRDGTFKRNNIDIFPAVT